MHFDALSLACLTSQLRATIQNARVQQVLMVDELSLGFELYGNQQRRYLFVSADPGAGRLYLVEQKLRRGTENQPPILLRLRKLVRGATVASVTQPDPAERILRLELDHARHGTTTLVIELIGRQSNVLLLDPADKILECLRRFRPPKELQEQQRTILPGQIYRAPALNNPVSPLSPELDSHVRSRLKEVDPNEKVRLFLVRQLSGVSPTQAREIAWRTAGDPEARIEEIDEVKLAVAIEELWTAVEDDDWHPGIVLEADQIIGFAPYELHFRGEFQPCDSISQALVRFFNRRETPRKPAGAPSSVTEQEAVGAIDPYASLRRSVADQIRNAYRRIDRQLDALARDEPEAGEPDKLRLQAEWLLALSTQVEAEQTDLTIELETGALTIPLWPNKTPVEQAERMFDRAAKLERAAKFIPQRRNDLLRDREFLGQLELDLTQAENQPEVAAVQRELHGAGYGSVRRQPMQMSGPSKSEPRKFVSSDGYAILVGRNARQNDRLTFSTAGAADLWFHARGVPGSHVVLRTGGQVVHHNTIVTAAQLAAYYSASRGERAAQVSYTERRFVTRVPGGRPGQVFVRNENTITVPAELPAVP